MSVILTLTYRIHSYEADFTGKARIASILNYLQESAWNHAEALGVGFTHLREKNLAWVLGRLRLQVLAYPLWGQTVLVHTWPSGADRLFCFRDFRIVDEQHRTLAAATTSWLAVDIDRKRPQRTETYINLRIDGAEQVFSEFAPKVPLADGESAESVFRVAYSHLDVNGHMNNVKYVEGAIDALPKEFIERFEPADLTINFISEAFPGEDVIIQSASPGEGEWLQLMKRRSDGAELCRLHSVWRPAKDRNTVAIPKR